MKSEILKLKSNRIKKLTGLFLFFIIFGSLIFPLSTDAAPLVPCGRSDQGGQMCTLCHLIIGIKGIIDYGLKIMVILGITMLVIAGIVYIVSAGDEGMMTTAKGLLKNAVIGFAIILGAWLIVNTVLWIIGTKEKEHPEGGTLGIQIDSWNNFSCSTQSSAGTGSEPGQSDTSTPPKNETKGCGVTGKGKCFSGVVGSVSCPSGYSPTLGNPLNSCPSGQVCCEENGLPKDSEGRCGINNAGECKDGIVSCPSGWTATMGNIQKCFTFLSISKQLD
jgi:hypothetical protein